MDQMIGVLIFKQVTENKLNFIFFKVTYSFFFRDKKLVQFYLYEKNLENSGAKRCFCLQRWKA